MFCSAFIIIQDMKTGIIKRSVVIALLVGVIGSLSISFLRHRMKEGRDILQLPKVMNSPYGLTLQPTELPALRMDRDGQIWSEGSLITIQELEKQLYQEMSSKNDRKLIRVNLYADRNLPFSKVMECIRLFHQHNDLYVCLVMESRTPSTFWSPGRVWSRLRKIKSAGLKQVFLWKAPEPECGIFVQYATVTNCNHCFRTGLLHSSDQKLPTGDGPLIDLHLKEGYYESVTYLWKTVPELIRHCFDTTIYTGFSVYIIVDESLSYEENLNRMSYGQVFLGSGIYLTDQHHSGEFNPKADTK